MTSVQKTIEHAQNGGRPTTKKIIGFAIAFIVIVVTEYFYNEPLFDSPRFESISDFNGDMP